MVGGGDRPSRQVIGVGDSDQRLATRDGNVVRFSRARRGNRRLRRFRRHRFLLFRLAAKQPWTGGQLRHGTIRRRPSYLSRARH
jgi:hypothetical protein